MNQNTTDEGQQSEWPPSDCPPLAWPTLNTPEARIAWYRATLLTYLKLWKEDATEADFTPAKIPVIESLEATLACKLPAALRDFHLRFGITQLAETINGLDIEDDYGTKPLLDAYPGIIEIDLSPTELALANELIAFGDYLGNGNMWCFHRTTHAVYYFDHDSEPHLTHFFDDVQMYLDIVILKCLCEIYDDLEAEEAILEANFDTTLIKKWMY